MMTVIKRNVLEPFLIVFGTSILFEIIMVTDPFFLQGMMLIQVFFYIDRWMRVVSTRIRNPAP